MTNCMIKVSGIEKSFGPIRALEGISFSIASGDVFGCLGHNGAGKTTAIRLILGLLKPDSGSIDLLGYDPYPDLPSQQAVRRRVGVLLEKNGLYPRMTGRDNLSFWGNLYGIPREQVRARVEEVLDLMDLRECGNTLVCEYSKGMCRQLAIARALLNQPELLILDEPTEGLDPVARIHIRDILENLVSSKQLSIFISSHDLDEVEKLCNHIIILDNGKIVLSGTMDEVRKQRPELEIKLDKVGGHFLSESTQRQIELLPYVERIALEDDLLRVILTQPGQSANIISKLTEYGARIREARNKTRTLEDVYFSTMKKDDAPSRAD